METIVVKPLCNRGKEHIAIEAPYKGDINLTIRKLPMARWSQTHRVWYLPWGHESYKTLVAALKPLAVINHEQLRAYMDKRHLVKLTMAPPGSMATADSRANAQFQRKLPAETAAWQLSKENLLTFNRLVEQLKLEAYSPYTINTHRNEFLQLLKRLKQRPVNELTPDDLRRYMVFIMEKENVSEHTAHRRLNALKFYFEQVLNRERFFWEIPRPQKPQLLPKVLSQSEVAALLNSVQNQKHRAMLMLAYSGGLRVSEVVTLKTCNVDSQRMCIFLERAKGRKDRIVPQSPVLLVMLREYKPKKTGYLFEGQQKGSPYSARSCRKCCRPPRKKPAYSNREAFTCCDTALPPI